MARKSANATKATPQAKAIERLSEGELAFARTFFELRKDRPPLPRVKVDETATGHSVGWEHNVPAMADIQFANLLHSDDLTFSRGIFLQLARCSNRMGDLDPGDVSFALAIMRAIAPRDPIEALLATQMAAVHIATITAANRLGKADMLPQSESASNALNKLARTFAAQLEALKRFRSTGEQSIKVQHVTVNEGGQAIVGNVKTGGRDDEKIGDQSHALEAAPIPSALDARSPAMLGEIEAVRSAVPIARDEGP